ncbi:MAG: hypothetical protein ACR2FY_07670 [Pirellulaceae bacterium]
MNSNEQNDVRIGVGVSFNCPNDGLTITQTKSRLRKRWVAIFRINKLGGTIEYDGAKPFIPNWLQLLLGLKPLGEVVGVDLKSPKVTDTALTHVAGFSELTRLDLGGTRVTDAGLARLTGLTKLNWLNLGGTQVTDAGLTHLAGLTKLNWLYLHGTQVTDAGLVQLASLTGLEVVSLDSTQMTVQGLTELKKALPTLIRRLEVKEKSSLEL